ncbi:hypothetical protein PDIG_21720 [Penicillium digitatum PHI26]|uniref:Uncharacterized protein n=2 Tax=Penicillium digitatum TaxID=36651 RepID=K9GNA5_PEND2|nr:hypothetical protein PDIP_24000 [Penicillium digitatum Pd1]EKV16193.1 hypothetical protein PDIG_21720 [Penicillium digitatum PHI26]EKV19390.1 hypothetical protein PDIP_24000 [Penicillium digitatum Pd1]
MLPLEGRSQINLHRYYTLPWNRTDHRMSTMLCAASTCQSLWLG